ncbi:MAG: alpha-ketoacid dehydrogenase subunit beta [Lachnospiraceae bacterium]|nr:alpha-ketoacid dehydrogenase subunit beta [Lachnospiraceae bacterium]
MFFLIDIGVYAFQDVMKKYPGRVKNIGIFEPGTIGIAAGTALTGMIPTIYGISPFIVQRALEQIKLDFIYQAVGGNFITTGASYDFSTLGYSHYCAEDVATLKTLPGMEILVPGTPGQFTALFETCARNGRASYFRMTDHCNKMEVDVEFGKASVVKRGSKVTVITFAEMLDAVVGACADLDVTVLYYTTAEPFDYRTLRENLVGDRVFVCEPFYEGTFCQDVLKAVSGRAVKIGGVGVPREIMRSYGTKRDKDMNLGLTAKGIRAKIQAFIC